jgi:hypothetical protein
MRVNYYKNNYYKKKQFLRVYILILSHEFLRTKPIEFLQTIKLV